MTEPKTKMTKIKLDNLSFVTMPQDQGQIVTDHYACYIDHLVCWTTDASDRSESYRVAEIDYDRPEAETEYAPQNGQLPAHSAWERAEERDGYIVWGGHE